MLNVAPCLRKYQSIPGHESGNGHKNLKSNHSLMKGKSVMKKLLLVPLLIISQYAFTADDSAKRAELEKMFALTNMDSMMDGMYAQMGAMFEQMVAQQNIPAQEQEAAKKYFVKMEALLREEMGWSKMKEPVMEAYARVYTVDELKAINEFYSTPAGKKMIEKMPQLMQETMQISQAMAQKLIPKFQALAEEMKQEVSQSP